MFLLMGCGSESSMSGVELNNEFTSICPDLPSDYKPLVFSVDNNVAKVSGVSCSGSPKAFTSLLAKYKNVKNLVLLNINGSVDDVSNLELGRLIRDNNIKTSLLSSSHVTSGGVDLYLAGNVREWAKGAKLGVHSWSNGVKDGSEFPSNSDEHKKYLDYYKYLGVNEEFYWFTLKAASSNDMHYMTLEELKRFAIVPDAPSDADFTVSFFDTIRDNLLLKENMLNVQLMSLAKNYVDIQVIGTDSSYLNIEPFLNSLNTSGNIMALPYLYASSIQVSDSNTKETISVVSGYEQFGRYQVEYKEEINALIVLYPRIFDSINVKLYAGFLKDDLFLKENINYNFLNTMNKSIIIEYQCGNLDKVLNLEPSKNVNISCNKDKVIAMLKINGKVFDNNDLPVGDSFVVIH